MKKAIAAIAVIVLAALAGTVVHGRLIPNEPWGDVFCQQKPLLKESYRLMRKSTQMACDDDHPQCLNMIETSKHMTGLVDAIVEACE